MNTDTLRALLRKIRPTATEQGEWRGALSTFAEWHAAGLGLAIGAVAAAVAQPELMVSIVLIAIGEAEAQGEQLKDIAREPAYAVVGLAAGYFAVGFGANPEALQALAELFQKIGAGGLG